MTDPLALWALKTRRISRPGPVVGLAIGIASPLGRNAKEFVDHIENGIHRPDNLRIRPTAPPQTPTKSLEKIPPTFLTQNITDDIVNRSKLLNADNMSILVGGRFQSLRPGLRGALRIVIPFIEDITEGVVNGLRNEGIEVSKSKITNHDLSRGLLR